MSFLWSSEINSSVPPVLKVENISWKETSKLNDANCNVLPPIDCSELLHCQLTIFTAERWLIATPLGLPVEPDVWTT